MEKYSYEVKKMYKRKEFEKEKHIVLYSKQ